MATRRRALLGALLTTSILGSAFAAPAVVLGAVDITVNTLADSNTAGDGACSLREAITAANLNAGNTNDDCVDGSSTGYDAIVWAVEGTITLTSNLPDITDALAIDGNLAMIIDGADAYRPFQVISGGLTLREITIQNGFAGGPFGFGGAISNGSSTALDLVTIRSSRASYGGGIHNNGTMVIGKSTIEGNSATTSGGGIYNESSLTARNVTITGNTAPAGGGFATVGAATVVHATIARNTANTDSGGGFIRAGGTLDLYNSLVVGNGGGQGVGSYGSAGDLVQASTTGVIDTALRDNGGDTLTLRLPAGSPALSIGEQTWCGFVDNVDQRGLARPNGATAKCDAGAVQRDRTAPVMTAKPQLMLRNFVSLSGTSLRAWLSGWQADDGAGIGTERFSLQRQVNGGDWSTVSTSITPHVDAAAFPTTGSYNVNLSKDKRYRFRIRAVDEDGNISGWAYTPTVTARLYQQTNSRFTFSSGWTTATSDKYSGGSVRYTKTDGKSLRMTFTGRAFAFVTTVRAGQPLTVDSYLDGVATGQNSISSSVETKLRAQLWTQTWPTSARRTIRYVIDGTNRFDADAIAVLE